MSLAKFDHNLETVQDRMY